MSLFQNLRQLLGLPRPNTCLCMIVSEQEGADIYVNDRITGYRTPHAITLEKNSEVKVTLKLIGHFDHSAYVKTGHHLSYYHCQLNRIPLRLVSNEEHDTISI